MPSATRAIDDLLPGAFDVLDTVVERQSPRAIVSLLSGGHDSLTATAVAHEWAVERGVALEVAHVNTGIGIPATNVFAREVCLGRGWSFAEYHPPVSYDELVLRFGFPGPGYHELPYRMLKERCFRRIVAERKQERGDRVVLISGARRAESMRRTVTNVVAAEMREGARVWASPLWDWTKLDCGRFMADRDLPRNDVVDLLHMSGECLCGAFARPNEFEEIREWFPATAERIARLEEKARAAGLHGCAWGKRPPKVHREQMQLAIDAEPGGAMVACQDCAP